MLIAWKSHLVSCEIRVACHTLVQVIRGNEIAKLIEIIEATKEDTLML